MRPGRPRFDSCPTKGSHFAQRHRKNTISQRYDENLLKLKWAELRSQNPVTVNGDQVPAFHSDFLPFPCLEMVPFPEILKGDLLCELHEDKGEADQSAVFLAPPCLRMTSTSASSQSLGAFHYHPQLSEFTLSSLAMHQSSSSPPFSTSHLVPCTRVCPFCFTSP